LNLIVLFFTYFCFPDRKVVQILLPQPKNRSRTYGSELMIVVQCRETTRIPAFVIWVQSLISSITAWDQNTRVSALTPTARTEFTELIPYIWSIVLMVWRIVAA